MRFLRSLALLILLLSLLAIGLNFALHEIWGFGPDPVFGLIFNRLPEWMHPVEALRGWAFFLLGMLVLYCLLNVVIWYRHPRPLRVRSLEGSTILIHPGAVIKFVKLQIESHPAVVDSRVRVRQAGGNNLSIWATIHVQPIESLPVITEQIKRAIREGMTLVMGFERIDDIQLLLDIDEKNLGARPGADLEPGRPPVPPPRTGLDEPDATNDGEAGGQTAPEPAGQREPDDHESKKDGN